MNQSFTSIDRIEPARPGKAERIVYPENPRYRRIRILTNLMDRSILLPSGYRIGLDPLLGLIPGIGDLLGTLVSLYLVFEAALLGMAKRHLLQMLANIALEGVVGAVPVLGDIFDAVWKANVRNLALIDRHYHPAMRTRSAAKLAIWMLAVAGAFIAVIGTAFYLMVVGLASLFHLLFQMAAR